MRTGRQGGGTALLFRDPRDVKKDDGGEKVSFEFSEWTVRMASSHDLRVVIIYRPQTDSDNHLIPTRILGTTYMYLETIVLCEEQLVVIGDFNIHVVLSNDSNLVKLLDLLESFSLQQHVIGPTQVCGHTLDLIIAR